jgi:hypothetical protein
MVVKTLQVVMKTLRVLIKTMRAVFERHQHMLPGKVPSPST